MKTTLKKFLKGKINLIKADLPCLCGCTEPDSFDNINDTARSCVYDEEGGVWCTSILDDGTCILFFWDDEPIYCEES